MCQGCIAHPCMEVCPKGAISQVDGKSVIDQEKCIKCGRCKAACPYDAISKKERPCSMACGIGAIGTDEYGRAKIDADKCKGCTLCARTCPNNAIIGSVKEVHMIDQSRCVKCGACMEKCRFGAIYKE